MWKVSVFKPHNFCLLCMSSNGKKLFLNVAIQYYACGAPNNYLQNTFKV